MSWSTDALKDALRSNATLARLNPAVAAETVQPGPAATGAGISSPWPSTPAWTALDDYLWVLHADPGEVAEALAGLREVDFERYIIAVALHYGQLVWHTRDARRQNLVGMPDLLIVGRTVIWAELKTPHGRLTVEQKQALARLDAAGQVAKVWRPADWPEIRRSLADNDPRSTR